MNCKHCSSSLTLLLQLSSSDGSSQSFVYVCLDVDCTQREPRFVRVLRKGIEAEEVKSPADFSSSSNQVSEAPPTSSDSHSSFGTSESSGLGFGVSDDFGFGDSQTAFGGGDFGTCGSGFKTASSSSWLDDTVDDVSLCHGSHFFFFQLISFDVAKKNTYTKKDNARLKLKVVDR